MTPVSKIKVGVKMLEIEYEFTLRVKFSGKNNFGIVCKNQEEQKKRSKSQVDFVYKNNKYICYHMVDWQRLATILINEFVFL